MPSKRNYVIVCKYKYSMPSYFAWCEIAISVYKINRYCQLFENRLDNEM